MAPFTLRLKGEAVPKGRSEIQILALQNYVCDRVKRTDGRAAGTHRSISPARRISSLRIGPVCKRRGTSTAIRLWRCRAGSARGLVTLSAASAHDAANHILQRVSKCRSGPVSAPAASETLAWSNAFRQSSHAKILAKIVACGDGLILRIGDLRAQRRTKPDQPQLAAMKLPSSLRSAPYGFRRRFAVWFSVMRAQVYAETIFKRRGTPCKCAY
jgi:hypothetical protein